jgi:hypothetical protein
MIELPEEFVAPGKGLSKQGRDDGPLVRRERPEFGIGFVPLSHVAKVQPSSLGQPGPMSSGRRLERDELSGPAIVVHVSFVEVAIPSALGSRDGLLLRAEPWQESSDASYEGPDIHLTLTCGRLQAESVLPAYVADAERLGPFFHEIDRDWRGWDGEKQMGVPGRDWLTATARHDGRGHVALEVSLADGWPGSEGWAARGRFAIDVGSAASIAKALDDWLLVVWPRDHRWRRPTP